ncbi:hypothetical protein SDRG_08782 [Saprolegnia diclina VS20]|uniref:Apple domain-containing protein n=1 Tax=Saprolegnia diclina (strain VS20) TaxID=1156394 RepID=T0RMV6_SAPDV|nr:hypothetical protein SDRG_08782 [Saprolegnia diclina VS20]EQC33678.1 hypothetical protein SDRG_08782 [Saprolegnia diclina VS20]|eukprot:XP_008612901.1 hypothetical protein SDRG_08782 [Saprolegnia diclina VS20]
MVMKLATTLLALAAPLISGHGIVSNPPAEFRSDVMRTKYVATIQANFPGKFDDSPQTNVANFNKAFKAQSQFKTLRDMLDPHGPDCGYTLTNVDKKAIPGNGQMTWKNPDTGEGFIPSHKGPCEVWIDNERVFQNDDCATNFPQSPEVNLPVDYSSCGANGCMLRFYWLALHEPMWQVYKNCVPLKGNGQGPAPGPAPLPNGGQCSNVQANVDYYGNDIKNLGVWGSNQDKVSACCKACTSTGGCKGFTVNGDTCWLKSKLENPSPRDNCFSAANAGSGPAPLPNGGQCSNVQANVDYYGNDIKNLWVSGNDQDKVSACCNACSSTGGCNGFTVNGNTCWLKSKLENPSPRDNCFSATGNGASNGGGSSAQCGSVASNVDYYGNDIRNFQVNGDANSQLSQCCNGCSSTGGCVGFSINGGTCWLKSKLENYRTSNGVVSGRIQKSRLRRV